MDFFNFCQQTDNLSPLLTASDRCIDSDNLFFPLNWVFPQCIQSILWNKKWLCDHPVRLLSASQASYHSNYFFLINNVHLNEFHLRFKYCFYPCTYLSVLFSWLDNLIISGSELYFWLKKMYFHYLYFSLSGFFTVPFIDLFCMYQKINRGGK